MEINATEVPEVISTETTTETLEVKTTEATETLDQSTLPVAAAHQQTTTETAEQSPPLVTNMPPAETSLPEVTTNTQTTENLEQSTRPDVVNTQATEPPSDLSTQSPVTNIQTSETETLEQSASELLPLTDTKTAEAIEQQTVIPSEVVADSSRDNLVASPENHQGMEVRQETVEEEEEVRSVLKVIAATGKFWHDWEKLRSMLSLHLKQVISEYPQAKMTKEEQKISLGETHAELVKRLDDALHSFVDGPPFTLQRLSEIILDAQILYPNLSKLALALEKNLSVTSTLAISTDPYPPHVTTPNGQSTVTEDPNPIPNPIPNSDTVMENGAPPVVVADRDEIMAEVEADVGGVMTMDMDTSSYEKPSSVESSSMTTGGDS